jgi:predicted Rossmann fold flavoprotein
MLDVLIVGAGASGCFTAIRLKELLPQLNVCIVERASRPLQKVRISGGGRCNVTHNSSDVGFLLQHYPRKHKQLKGQLMEFSPQHMQQWLKQQGVETHAEADGRIFPMTNSSETIIQAFMKRLRELQVEIHYNSHVQCAEYNESNQYFEVDVLPAGQAPIRAKYVVLATGSHMTGYALAEQLGLELKGLVPSLFTFEINDAAVHERAGLSLQEARLRLSIPNEKKPFEQEGPLLFTHWGMSGPAVLKLSARAALALHASHYQATLYINALATHTHDDVRNVLQAFQQSNPKKRLQTDAPFLELPRRYWQFILQQLHMNEEMCWNAIHAKELNRLCEALLNLPLKVTGKGVFKEEFVTAGGVATSSLNLKTLEAKCQQGLFVAGELLDVDAMTGGFNFQHCWASADAIARHLSSLKRSAPSVK